MMNLFSAGARIISGVRSVALCMKLFISSFFYKFALFLWKTKITVIVR